jgi:hypothetical protein
MDSQFVQRANPSFDQQLRGLLPRRAAPILPRRSRLGAALLPRRQRALHGLDIGDTSGPEKWQHPSSLDFAGRQHGNCAMYLAMSLRIRA